MARLKRYVVDVDYDDGGGITLGIHANSEKQAIDLAARWHSDDKTSVGVNVLYSEKPSYGIDSPNTYGTGKTTVK